MFDDEPDLISQYQNDDIFSGSNEPSLTDIYSDVEPSGNIFGDEPSSIFDEDPTSIPSESSSIIEDDFNLLEKNTQRGQVVGMGTLNVDDDENLLEQYQGINSAIKTHLRNDLARSDSLGLEVNMLDTAILDDENSPIDNIIGRRFDPISKAKLDYHLVSNFDIVNQMYVQDRTGYKTLGVSNFEKDDWNDTNIDSSIHSFDDGDWTSGNDWTKGDDWTSGEDWIDKADPFLEESDAERILGTGTKKENNSIFSNQSYNENSSATQSDIESGRSWEDEDEAEIFQEKDELSGFDKSNEIYNKEENFENNKEDVQLNENDSNLIGVSAATILSQQLDSKKIRLDNESAAESLSRQLDSKKIVLSGKSVAEEFLERSEKIRNSRIKKIEKAGNEVSQSLNGTNSKRNTIEDSYEQNESDFYKKIEKENRNFYKEISSKKTDELINLKNKYQNKAANISDDKREKIDIAVSIIDLVLNERSKNIDQNK